MNEKICDNCTKCCEGYLKLSINGQKVQPGSPCPLLIINSGCSDYENRPAMPCKTYKCEWIKMLDMPDKFKPKETDFIVHKRWINKKEYYTLIPAGTRMTKESIRDICSWFESKGKNFFYTYEDIEYFCGTDDFIKDCYNKKDNTWGEVNG